MEAPVQVDFRDRVHQCHRLSVALPSGVRKNVCKLCVEVAGLLRDDVRLGEMAPGLTPLREWLLREATADRLLVFNGHSPVMPNESLNDFRDQVLLIMVARENTREILDSWTAPGVPTYMHELRDWVLRLGEQHGAEPLVGEVVRRADLLRHAVDHTNMLARVREVIAAVEGARGDADVRKDAAMVTMYNVLTELLPPQQEAHANWREPLEKLRRRARMVQDVGDAPDVPAMCETLNGWANTLEGFAQAVVPEVFLPDFNPELHQPRRPSQMEFYQLMTLIHHLVFQVVLRKERSEDSEEEDEQQEDAEENWEERRQAFSKFLQELARDMTLADACKQAAKMIRDFGGTVPTIKP